MSSYYNEIDPYAAQWLRNLIAENLIAPGEVDERSIVDVRPADLAGFKQCHFFAGIGGWSLAARLAGWPDSRELWTGSCPCQPFSSAGQGRGFDDERHLWPAFFNLIAQCRPAAVFGEQVASADGLKWLDLVRYDLEAAQYRVAAADLCAAGVGAPHIRQRLWWVADASDAGQQRWRASEASNGRNTPRLEFERLCDAGGLADAERERGCGGQSGGKDAGDARIASEVGGLGHPDSVGAGRNGRNGSRAQASGGGSGQVHGHLRDGADVAGSDVGASPLHGFWSSADWLYCRDGKWRPVEPGTFPLAHGVPARVGRLRAYGNAINVEAARVFIEAVMDCAP